MWYSTPLPVQEYVRYRLDGEFELSNTAAIIVSTSNPLITQTLIANADKIASTTLPNSDPDATGPNTAWESTARMVPKNALIISGGNAPINAVSIDHMSTNDTAYHLHITYTQPPDWDTFANTPPPGGSAGGAGGGGTGIRPTTYQKFAVQEAP